MFEFFVDWVVNPIILFFGGLRFFMWIMDPWK